VEPKVAEFLRFVLSAEGQALVERKGDYLPLNGTVASEQRKKLE
jgi:phosphate transport system substrate-binding protein